MLSNRYSIPNLKRALENPIWIARELHRLISLPTYPLYNRYFARRYGRGIDVTEREWDNLLILDACRYDYFAETNTIGGDLQRFVSRGAHSWEFMEGNFVGRSLHDTVYVTANPHAEKLSADVFYAVETLLDRWDEDLETVRPEDVVEGAIEAHERYPDKKLVVHFMQPHTPYLGPTAERLRESGDFRGWDKYYADEERESELAGTNIWTRIYEGDVTREAVCRAYAETLDIVLDHAEKLIQNLDGKSVVTSDHGELLGERVLPLTVREYGHPANLYTPELCFVPWLEVPTSNRRDVTAEAPIETERLEEDVVSNRLKALGYAAE